MWLDDEDAQAARVRKTRLPHFLITLCFTCRRLSSSVWNGYRLMSSCASSLRVTEQGTERGTSGGTGKATTPTAAPTLPPPYTSAAPTTGAAAAAEATTPAMVGTFQPREEWGRAAVTSDPPPPPILSPQEPTMIIQTLLRRIRSAGMSWATGPWLEKTRTGECSSRQDVSPFGARSVHHVHLGLIPALNYGRSVLRLSYWALAWALIRLSSIRLAVNHWVSMTIASHVQLLLQQLNFAWKSEVNLFLIGAGSPNTLPWRSCNVAFVMLDLCGPSKTLTAWPQGQGERPSPTERRSQEARTQPRPRGRTGRARKRRRTRRIQQQLW